MLDLSTAKERQRKSNHAKHMAKYYINSTAELFVESDRNQAVEICNISSKSVLCVDTHELFSPGVKEYILKKNARSYFLKILFTKVAVRLKRVVLLIRLPL